MMTMMTMKRSLVHIEQKLSDLPSGTIGSPVPTTLLACFFTTMGKLAFFLAIRASKTLFGPLERKLPEPHHVLALGYSCPRRIHNTKREDVTFMAFQIWVMGMSVIALMNESIPHIFVVLITHVLATTWSGFQISNTRQFNQSFQQTTLKADSCNINLLPSYWSQRNAAEV